MYNFTINNTYNPQQELITNACISYPALEHALPILIISLFLIFFLRYYIAILRKTELKKYDKHNFIIHQIVYYSTSILFLLMGCVIGFIIIY